MISLKRCKCEAAAGTHLFTILIFTILTTACTGSQREEPLIAPQAKNARVLVLSKYAPREVTLSAKTPLTLIAGRSLRSADSLHLVIGQDKISAVNLADKISAEYFAVNCDSPVTITVEGAKGTLSRTYPGTLDFFCSNGSIGIVTQIDINLYARAAARAESQGLEAYCGGHFDELLRAMEIVIRSYILAEGDRHDSELYDFCDLTHCFVFTGIQEGDVPLAPDGVLVYKKEIIAGYFHASCGGSLIPPHEFWPRHRTGLPYRTGGDTLNFKKVCAGAPNFSWRSLLTYDEAQALFGYLPDEIAADYGGSLLRRGKVIRISAVHEGLKEEWAISDFLSLAGRHLGWAKIKSPDFAVTRIAQGWQIEGHGLGHGVGLCQYGAAELARRGFPAEKILRHYFGTAQIYRVER